jgi:hypothetical protein
MDIPASTPSRISPAAATARLKASARNGSGPRFSTGNRSRLATNVRPIRKKTGTLGELTRGSAIRKAPVRRKTRKNICSCRSETPKASMG